MNISEFIDSAPGQSLINALAKSSGQDVEQTEDATENILATLMAGMMVNATKPKGLESLDNALEKDHDGSLLDHIGDFISGNMPPSRSTNGEGIVRHIFGNNAGNAQKVVAAKSKIDLGTAAKWMITLAPIAMQLLGKQKKSGGVNGLGLALLLLNTIKSSKKKKEDKNILETIFGGHEEAEADQNPIEKIFGKKDKESDGNILEDLFGKNKKDDDSILEKLFGKDKKEGGLDDLIDMGGKLLGNFLKK